MIYMNKSDNEHLFISSILLHHMYVIFIIFIRIKDVWKVLYRQIFFINFFLQKVQLAKATKQPQNL